MALVTRKCKKAHVSATPEHPKPRVFNIWILVLYTWWVSTSFTSNSKTYHSFTNLQQEFYQQNGGDG